MYGEEGSILKTRKLLRFGNLRASLLKTCTYEIAKKKSDPPWRRVNSTIPRSLAGCRHHIWRTIWGVF